MSNVITVCKMKASRARIKDAAAMLFLFDSLILDEQDACAACLRASRCSLRNIQGSFKVFSHMFGF